MSKTRYRLKVLLNFFIGTFIGFVLVATFFLLLNLAVYLLRDTGDIISIYLCGVLLGIGAGCITYDRSDSFRKGAAVSILLMIYLYDIVAEKLLWLPIGAFSVISFFGFFIAGTFTALIFKAYRQDSNAKFAESTN